VYYTSIYLAKQQRPHGIVLPDEIRTVDGTNTKAGFVSLCIRHRHNFLSALDTNNLVGKDSSGIAFGVFPLVTKLNVVYIIFSYQLSNFI
jgi:hypothetical protein